MWPAAGIGAPRSALTIDNRGKATATVFMPHEAFPVARNVEQETSPPVVANETPSPESVPKQLDAYGLKPIRVFGTTRLRHGAKVTRVAFTNDGKPDCLGQ